MRCIFAPLLLVRPTTLLLMTFLYALYFNELLGCFVAITFNNFPPARIYISQRNIVMNRMNEKGNAVKS